MIPLTPNYILQLHRDLLQFTTLNYGGHFKTVANDIEQVNADGSREVIFVPPEPSLTPDAVRQICDSYRQAKETQAIDELILIPCFILDFLCIHPFIDGNGRMSRLLTLLLLYQNGYMAGKYISIEKAIAETKESYYSALAVSDRDWMEGENDPKAFIRYMQGIILKCYRDFESRIIITEKTGTRSTSVDIVRQYAESRIGTFTKAEALAACPSLGSSSVEAALKKLVEDGTLIRTGAGRKTHYARKP